MKRLFLFLLLLTVTASRSVVLAQETSGVVTYERVTSWTKLYKRLTFLSQEEKDRIQNTWKNDDESKEKMKLTFNPDQTLYTYASDQGETEDGTWSWRNRDYIIQRDFKNGKKTEIVEMLGKTYVLEDSLGTPNWKIMNQLRDIAGYVCMKAVTEDPVKGQKITAWFSQDLASQAGPERYFGLPGLIMELDVNEGDVVITATKVELKNVDAELALPKKIKGKKIKDADYDQLIREHISTSMKAHRNPYWSIRY